MNLFIWKVSAFSNIIFNDLHFILLYCQYWSLHVFLQNDTESRYIAEDSDSFPMAGWTESDRRAAAHWTLSAPLY